MTEPRACELCGNVFSPKSFKQRYCPTCDRYRHANYAARRPMGEWATCPMCGAVCTTESGFCRRHGGDALPDRECPVCGGRFSPKNVMAVYCSPRCKSEAAGRPAPEMEIDSYIPVRRVAASAAGRGKEKGVLVG